MNPSTTLREIATIAANPVVKARLEQLASEFEVQHNQQNNNWAVALGRAQLTWEEGLQDLRLDFANKLESILIEMRKEFRDIDTRLDRLVIEMRGGDHADD